MNENKGVLVVALPSRGMLTPAAYELLTVGRSLADSLKEPLSAVVLAGSKAAELAKDLAGRGPDKVFTVEHPSLENFTDELYARAVADLALREKVGKILLASSVAGRSLAARLSALLKAGLAVEVSEVAQNGAGLKAKRSQYSGNVICEVEFKSPVQILTVQGLVFARAEKTGREAPVEAVPFAPAGPARVEFVSFTPEESNEVDLGAAERVVSAGRGLGSAEGLKPVRELAHTINAAVGASRAVVDSGWIAYRHQVGLTGRAVRPKLYVACGISGQIQHLAGMSSSGTIVAINTDPECPLMQMASISVVADVAEFLPLLTEEIRKRRGASA